MMKDIIIKIKNIIPLILLIALIGLIVGCQDGKDNTGNANDGVDSLTITMIGKSSENPVFLSAKTGAMEKAEDISEKYNSLKVIINWKTPEKESASKQAAIIHNAVKHGTDAIIVSCSDKDTLTSAINYAVDNGVPVMTFDSDDPDSKRFAFYGPDDIEMGEKIMTGLAGLINGTGKIAILGGNRTANNLQERIEGIKKAAFNYPGIDIVGTFYHPETQDDAIAVMKKVQETYPDLKGWAMVGGWPLFGDKLEHVMEPGKIKIVAVDALPIQLKYIEKNYVQILLGQPTFKWGEITVETVVDKIFLHKKVSTIIRMKTIPVSIENLGGWSRQLKAWGYKNIPDKYFAM